MTTDEYRALTDEQLTRLLRDVWGVSQADKQKAEAQARTELRDRFAIEIVGSLILRMPADNVITPAMCKTVWTISDAMIKERGE